MSPVPVTVEFPLARSARERYAFFQPSFSDFQAARTLADSINLTRDLKNNPELTVKAGQLAAAALLDEIFAYVMQRYVEEVEPTALDYAPVFLDSNLGEQAVAVLIERLDENFPTLEPLIGRPPRVERLLRLWLANQNPAITVFKELFDDAPLAETVYQQSLLTLHSYFDTLPPFGPGDLNLIDLLLLPIRRHPDSVEKQLGMLLDEWGDLVAPFATRILTHMDLIHEEEKPMFFGPGPSIVPTYEVGRHEYEAFTPDKEWMPSVVLLAKQTYVWLDQLTKKYGHHIYRLDMVPDEELDELAKAGFTGLWLIGVWQRSKASQKIKQMAGNPDAIASAYSLHSYDIAWELGGQEAMDDLRRRAAARGIRMASDMVPNHMAIDSQWVVDHPDWFIQLPYPPYGHAKFDTPDLCDDDRVEVHIEAGYYDKTDASVVFLRNDRYTGEKRYIYHGNDGTSYPWNDTAQLNYLMPEVREAVIRTIIHVARQFPIIRFDAAMTLAKRHYHRLWFPAPGHGGDIPSRAGRGLPPDEFDRLMPKEFWREVVDRIAAEAPDTLLLAEAFWLMEGYFVRTLGMHRVYNSAFMNMMRDEENTKYRLVLKNTLEFDPDILGRFVNFINNPDEKTAVEQFGKGDKYFGVCTMMATLPGLPMFGHGQVEGYAEKYGMEYPRAYWNEVPDVPFVEHHKRVIYPLLHKRYLFAGSENFVLFDYWTGDGNVNENVFAYTNRVGTERALVIFNNRYAPTGGWLKSSAAVMDKTTGQLGQRELSSCLGLSNGDRQWAIFRDTHTGLEYLRSSRELHDHGLYVELKEYGCHVFMDWREVTDTHGHYAKLATYLQGGGVRNVEIALKEMVLKPLLEPLQGLCEPELWKALWTSRNPISKTAKAEFAAAWKSWEEHHTAFTTAAQKFLKGRDEVDGIRERTDARLKAVLDLPAPATGPEAAELGQWLAQPEVHLTLMLWAAFQEIGDLLDADDVRDLPSRSRAAFDDWLLGHQLEPVYEAFGIEAATTRPSLAALRILLAHSLAEPAKPFDLLSALLEDDEVQLLLNVNRHASVIWFRSEGLESLMQWLTVATSVAGTSLPLELLERAAIASEWKLVRWMEIVRRGTETKAAANGRSQPAEEKTAAEAKV